ncbi:MAG: phosphotransferase [Gammaproteobacteria bacterium]
MPITETEARDLCARLLKADLDSIDFPGGKSRESLRAKIAENSIILTKRKHLERAKLESFVLRTLNRYRAPVPHLIAAHQHYLIQQDVGGTRLSESLQGSDEDSTATLVKSALGSLANLHQIGLSDEAFNSVVVLGNKDSWLRSFIKAAERLGTVLGLPAPKLNVPSLSKLLTVEEPQLIKWDARPGNAIVRDNGAVIWIDWEHCGRRHPLDDVAWLMNDEFMPYYPAMEKSILDKAIPLFGKGMSAEQAMEYYCVFSCLHACVRLELIISFQVKKGWWDYDYCVRFDKVGVVKDLALQVARRASNLSQISSGVAPLTSWFDDIGSKIELLD